MKDARPVELWAVVVTNPRSRWIYHASIARTRRAAKAAYMEGWTDPATAARYWRKGIARKTLSLRRVVVSVAEVLP